MVLFGKKFLVIFSLLIVTTLVTSIQSDNPYTYNIKEQPTSKNITNIFNNITINGTELQLNNLSDVQAPNPQDGESLVWSSSLSKWISDTVISRWVVDTVNGFLYTDSDTLFFNDTLLNNTIDARAASVETNFNIFINGSSYNNINHNITAGDASNVEFTIIPGNKFIFGETFT